MNNFSKFWKQRLIKFYLVARDVNHNDSEGKCPPVLLVFNTFVYRDEDISPPLGGR